MLFFVHWNFIIIMRFLKDAFPFLKRKGTDLIHFFRIQTLAYERHVINHIKRDESGEYNSQPLKE